MEEKEQDTFSRRTFLKKAGTLSIGVFGATIAASLPVYAKRSKKRNIETVETTSEGAAMPGFRSPIPEMDGHIRKWVANKKPLLKIGITPPALSEYYDEIFHGCFMQMAEYDALYGLKFAYKIAAPREHEQIEDQISIIKNWATLGYDAVLICTGADITAMNKVFGDMLKRGTRIYLFNMPSQYLFHEKDSPFPIYETNIRSTIGYNNMFAHEMAAHWLAELLTMKYGDPKGKLALVWGLPGHWAAARERGLKAGLSSYPKIEIVTKGIGDYIREGGMREAEAMLEAYPDLDVLYGENEEMGLGAAQAALERGLDLWDFNRKKGVITLGADGLISGYERIREKNATGTINVNPVDKGRAMIQAVFYDSVMGWNIDRIWDVPTHVVDIRNVDIDDAYAQWAMTFEYKSQ
jgi:ribose transport system substrate-binding protein